MTQSISLLGSTGSIGRQTLDAAEHLGITVAALAANRASGLFEEQVRRYKPALAAVFDEDAARDFSARVADTNTRVVSGMAGLCEAASIPSADTALIAVSGTVGILPTLAAIEAGKRIALANKETLVCAGDLVMGAARRRGVQVIPVDSEHSAIFQCMAGLDAAAVRSVILTASGGPFRGMNREQLKCVTPEMALHNPNWSMGPKITVDSATLMNKGLEFIEAMHLFNMPPERIEVIVHPQSIIHSMVRTKDGSVLAQLGVPDMRLPIQYALTYPDRVASQTAELDFAKTGTLTFEEPDLDAFPCLALAKDAARRGGTACAVLCGADDMAVELFIAGKIGWSAIYESVAAALDSIKSTQNASVDDIIATIEAARRFVMERAE